MMGEDGSTQTDVDFNLLIAKSLDGVAPTSLGSVNAARTGCFELPRILLGCMKLEGDTNRAGILHVGFGSIWYFNMTGNNGHVGPVVIQPDEAGTSGLARGAATQRIYVAGIAGGAFDFSTGVLSTGAISAEANATIAVDGVDPRKCFQIGDTVYVHDVDTAAGTVKSMTSGTIVLNAVTAVAVANNDELVNANPIRVTLGFKR